MAFISSRMCFMAFFLSLLKMMLFSPATEDNSDVTPCSGMSLLHHGCSITEDCSTITCRISFVDEAIALTLKVNNCDDFVTVTATMDIWRLHVTWTRTFFTGDDIIQVPGFTVSLPLNHSANVYVQVGLNKDGEKLHLAVKLLAGKGEVWDKGFYRVNTTVMEGDLPITSNECGIFKWWYNLSDLEKSLLVGVPLGLLTLTVVGCSCRCVKSNVNVNCCH